MWEGLRCWERRCGTIWLPCRLGTGIILSRVQGCLLPLATHLFILTCIPLFIQWTCICWTIMMWRHIIIGKRKENIEGKWKIRSQSWRNPCISESGMSKSGLCRERERAKLWPRSWSLPIVLVHPERLIREQCLWKLNWEMGMIGLFFWLLHQVSWLTLGQPLSFLCLSLLV